jgi:hypothetical protein
MCSCDFHDVAATVVAVHDDVVCFISADALAAAATAVVTVPLRLDVAVVVAVHTASDACFFHVCRRGNKMEEDEEEELALLLVGDGAVAVSVFVFILAVVVAGIAALVL